MSAPGSGLDAGVTQARPQAGLWRRWIERPQEFAFRRVLFKIHLWVALALGVYVILISLSGSAVVFRSEISRWLVPREVPSGTGVRLDDDQIRESAELAYASFAVTSISEQRRENSPVYVNLERDGVESQRLFDPYARVDMGNSYPWPVATIEWLTDFHDNLLMSQTGRQLNGIGGAFFVFLVLSGLVLWWQGRRRWREGFVVKRGSPRPVVWQLHGALGIWFFSLLLIWGLTAIYFAWPQPFESTIDRFDPDPEDFERPGEAALQLLIRLHFGRFGGMGVRVTWALLGLLPAIMFISGFLMWLRSKRRQQQNGVRPQGQTPGSDPGV